MEQLITLTVEKPQMHGGKPTDRTYLEKNLPASLDKALREYIQGEKDKVSYMDCLWGELYLSLIHILSVFEVGCAVLSRAAFYLLGIIIYVSGFISKVAA